MNQLLTEHFVEDINPELAALRQDEAVVPTSEVIDQIRKDSNDYINYKLGDSLADFIVTYPGFYGGLTDLRELYLTRISTATEAEPNPLIDPVNVERVIREQVRLAISDPDRIAEMVATQQALLEAKLMTSYEIIQFIESDSEPMLFDQDAVDEGERSEELVLPVNPGNNLVQDFSSEFGQDLADDEEDQELRLSKHAARRRSIFETGKILLGRAPLPTREEYVQEIVGEVQTALQAIDARLEGEKLDDANPIHRRVSRVPRQVLIENFTGEVEAVSQVVETETSQPEVTKPEAVKGSVVRKNNGVLVGHGTFNISFGGK